MRRFAQLLGGLFWYCDLGERQRPLWCGEQSLEALKGALWGGLNRIGAQWSPCVDIGTDSGSFAWPQNLGSGLLSLCGEHAVSHTWLWNLDGGWSQHVFQGPRRKMNLLCDSTLPLRSCRIQLAPDALLKQSFVVNLIIQGGFYPGNNRPRAHRDQLAPVVALWPCGAICLLVVRWERQTERTKQSEEGRTRNRRWKSDGTQ